MFEWVRNDTGATASSTIISMALMLITGFLMTRLTKKLKLPNVTGYILAGILIGPYALNTIPASFIAHTDFLSDIALSFIAFSTGEFFRLSTIRQNGAKVIIITLFEALMASLLVFIAVHYLLGMDLAFSIVLAALASATAPASTMMTIRQTGAKGDFVNTLLQVVAFDDIVGLVAFSGAIAVALSSYAGTGLSLGAMVTPILSNIVVLLLGALFGALMKLFLQNRSSSDNRLIIAIAHMFAFCGISAVLGISPLLGCMAMSTVYINLTDDERLFRQLGYFSPPILLMFFVRSGMNFDLKSVLNTGGSIGAAPLLLVGVVYFLVRIVGKYVGAWIGCAVVGKDRKVRNYLGMALVPQAGVAIGLAALGARTLGGETGAALQNIILASSILYELAGPGLAKLSLYLSGSYSNQLEEIVQVAETDANGKPKTEAQKLIERVDAIQKELAAQRKEPSEEEKAFTEEAVRYYEQMLMNWGEPETARDPRARGGRRR
ncbi:MAG: cation:proton antiporter [Clostridia bacterium]|nr:cation:proton antiporter [Clostridia bacterium]